jgi:plasmid stabilization system protein ParE
MSYNVSILAEAEADIDSAYIWYESKQLNLGNKFFKIVADSVNYISKNPRCCEEIYKGTRRFVIKKFPYGIYYKVNFDSNEIQIIGVIHFKRTTRIIKSRL